MWTLLNPFGWSKKLRFAAACLAVIATLPCTNWFEAVRTLAVAALGVAYFMAQAKADAHEQKKDSP